MNKRKITIVEYHSHGDGPRFFPDLFQREAGETEEIAEVEEENGGRSIGPLLGIIGLIAVAAAYRYYRSRGEEKAIDTKPVEVTPTER